MAWIPWLYKITGGLLVWYAFYDHVRLQSPWRWHAFYTGLALFFAGQVLGFLSGPLIEHVVAIRTILDQVQKAPRP